jgi:hypothetical protein
MKTDSKKATHYKAGRKPGNWKVEIPNLTSPEISIPSRFCQDSDMSKGFWRLK